MNKLFYLQLLSSFIVGGTCVALLSFIAEKANQKVAGIILALPSTVVISYFFIGLTTSAKTVGEIASTSVASDTAALIFMVVYIYLAQIKLPKIYSIILSLLGSVASWILLAVPLAVYKFNNIFWSIIIFLVGLIFAYYFLTYKNKLQGEPTTINYSHKQKIGRAIFIGLIIALAVFVSKILQPFWGGIIGVFPAATISTYLIMHWYYGPNMLLKISKTTPLGSLSFISYVIAAHWTFPAFGLIGGTLITYAISLVIFLIIYKIQNEKR